MSRCGCGGGRCECVIVAGDNITVEGDGGTAAPYVISATGAAVTCEQVRPCLSVGPGATYDPATGVIGAAISADPDNQVALGSDDGLFVPPGGTSLQAQDSPTLDLELTGDGSAGNPYVVQGDVILDPAPPGGGTNLIQEGPDGLYVECTQVRGCLSAGPGVSYDPATGEIAANISSDAGNQVSIGGDDGLYVSASGGSTVTVQDSSTVDMSGDGSAGSPITAAVIPDPAAGNLLTTGPAGVAVPCEAVQDCVGSALGDGLMYDDAANEFRARLSTQVGNNATFGPDGGLYVPASGGSTVTVQDSSTVDMSGDGSAGSPITAAVIPDPAAGNLLTTGPAGVAVTCEAVQDCVGAALGNGLVYDDAANQMRARLSTDAGNSAAFGGDGGIYVPTGGGATVVTAGSDCIAMSGDGSAGNPITAAPVVDPDPANTLECGPNGLRVSAPTLALQCGLTGDGSAGAPLGAAVQAWPYPCDVNDNAGGVYCDSSGQLRAEPRAKYQYFTTTLNELFPANPVVPATTTTGGTVVATRTLDITNPDPCRPAIAITSVEVDVDFVIPPGGRAGHFVYGDEMYRFENRGSATVSDVHTQTTKVLGNTTIPPGATITVSLDIALGFGLAGATYNRVQSYIRAMVFAL
ncbi:hypothetical protein [Streptosporangium sp. CA-115845]|uniref:hypothetical protein n=1 Tax=Streptosporangium sp. CA-115845 TaxID=3240071 RepID=UPI003D8F7DB4